MSLLTRLQEAWKLELINRFSLKSPNSSAAEKLIYPDFNQQAAVEESIAQLMLRIESGLYKPRFSTGRFLYDTIIDPQKSTPDKLVSLLQDLYLVLGVEIKAYGVSEFCPDLSPTLKKEAYDRLLDYGFNDNGKNLLEIQLKSMLTSNTGLSSFYNALFKNIGIGQGGNTLYDAIHGYLEKDSAARIESLKSIQYDSSLGALILGPDARRKS